MAPRGRSLLNRLAGLATSLLLVNYSLFSTAAGDQTWLPISNAEDLAECEISIKQRFQNRSIPLQVFQRDGRPCVNVNVDSDEWFMIDAVAFDRKRERLGFRQVGVESIRHAVLNGIAIKLSPLSREVVIDAKGPTNTASGCKVCVDPGARTVSGVTDEDGIFQFKVLMDEPVRQVTVWKTGLIGGFDASRTPIRNPYDDTYSVKMLSTRPFKLRLVHEDRPVSGVTFDLIYRTTPPAYNFVATSRTFMQTRLTTDSNGVAVADWFPDVARHTSYLSFGEQNLIVVFGFHRCFPCIRLTSWLDDHKAVLSKDFVLLKFNELCDLHTDNLRRRLFGSEYHGAPAFVIARPDGKVLASSAGPTGNIGYPVGVDELRHLTRMLMLGRKQLTDREIDAIVESLDGE